MHKTVCYLYLFTYGSYLRWAFGPNIPLLAILGSSVKERNYQGVLRGLAVFGIRYSAMRCVDGGILLEGCLSQGKGLWGLARGRVVQRKAPT